MIVIKESPVMVGEAKAGKEKYWKHYIYADGDSYFTGSESWSQTKDGESQHIVSAPALCSPKNVGRANETSSKEQAELEWLANIKLKLDKGYKDNSGQFGQGTSQEHNFPMPMLAHEYGKRRKSIKWPAAVQPKLDGVRALYDPCKGFWTRGGKPFIKEVTEHFGLDELNDYLPDQITLDGEFMMPQGYTFQETVAHCKKFRNQTGPLLEYHVFDCFIDALPDAPFDYRRFELLESYIGSHMLGSLSGFSEHLPLRENLRIKLVPTIVVNNEEEMLAAHANFIAQGYEGTMIRNLDSSYLVGHRSENLLKYKDFMDDEFTIVSVKDGVGKEEGLAVFICETSPQGPRFDARPRGTAEERRNWFYNFEEQCLGKKLTVRYQNLTDGGIPRFPVGISIRDEVQG